MWEKVKDKEGKAKQQGQVKCQSQSSSETTMKTFSRYFLYFQCVFPHAAMGYCWLSLKRQRAALPHCFGKVLFSINPSLKPPGLSVQGGAFQKQTSAPAPGPSSSAETPGAAEPCAGPGAPAPERNSSNWWFPHGWQPRRWLSPTGKGSARQGLVSLQS